MGLNINLSDETIFIGMIFIAAFLLMQSFLVPTFGENRKAQKRLKKRLHTIAAGADRGKASLMRRKYLRELSPIERALEALPGMARVERLVEQAGRETPAYRVVLQSLGLGGIFGAGGVLLLPQPLLGVLLGLGVAALPFMRLQHLRSQRLARFEEQLPDALIIMARALRAGHPFSDAMHLVAEEMADPIAGEFRTTFMEINYGGEVRTAMLGMLERVPSVTVMVFTTSVLIQKESGGNLAELLDGLAAVVRDRFRFQRKVRTLSAQGRMAAWILSLLPFALAGILTLVSPKFLPMLTQDPVGRQMIVAAFVMIVVGILWMRRIVRIDV
ncbi:MAG: type II secretion system F family protein [Halomonas sp.]|jgi:tight adherence protein B|uniref:Type II secretion system F family protein n=1 Tax=Billgrantia tianxiuensis TaxID=2497861 RepID=A0A6I6SLX5_9GAMM|nr:MULTISPECIES: type II secretion system F family protein [Halomonas]MCE8032449.1 type II secretion system F family protein [Halomonas sp. MCCC 1A11057]MDX5433638.1 type II secretion system F family protein [Halomonas sp.]QHC49586.1 type II secretion system F family protein [Halomonas tianxiuensis]